MGFKTGHKKAGGIKKGQKQYKTIEREKAREHFESIMMGFWERITLSQAKRALKDQKTAEFVTNQVIGKPKESIEVKGVKKLLIDMKL
jgi:hypothetical protein